MKQLILFSLIILFTINANAQSIKEYEQKIAECWSMENYKCAEENTLALIKFVGEDYGRLYLLYANLGTVQRRQHKMEEAKISYDKAYSLNKNSSDVLSNSASLKRQMNNLEGSLIDYNLAIDLKPNDEELLVVNIDKFFASVAVAQVKS